MCSCLGNRYTLGLNPSVSTDHEIIDTIRSISDSRHYLAYPSRQMTIFYAGQAHVFDDVHPNKVSSLLSTSLC